MRLAALAAHAAIVMALAGRLAAAQASIVGTVFDSLRTSAPLKFATVVIPELSRYVTTDAQGRFRIDSVPPGRYTMTFLHPILDSLDVSAEVLPITVPDKGIVIARLASPSPAALVWLICRAASDTFPAMMLGHVREAGDSAGVAAAAVTVSWSELVMGAAQLEQRTVHASAETRANGSYLLCGVPSTGRLEAVVSSGDRSTSKLILTLAGEVLVHRDFRLGRPADRATLSGNVRDAAGRPASNATVIVFGPRARALTDEGGRFSLTEIPAGTQLVEVRQVGSWPRTELVDIPASGTRDVNLSLGPRAPALAPVRAAVAGNADDDTGFDERRQAGIGQFIVRDANEKARPASLERLLLRASLLFVGSGRLHLIKMKGTGGDECTPNYFVNGYPWRGGIPGLAQPEFQQVIEPASLRGVEVFTHAAVPPMFDRRNGCGSVVMWTK